MNIFKTLAKLREYYAIVKFIEGILPDIKANALEALEVFRKLNSRLVEIAAHTETEFDDKILEELDKAIEKGIKYLSDK